MKQNDNLSKAIGGDAIQVTITPGGIIRTKEDALAATTGVLEKARWLASIDTPVGAMVPVEILRDMLGAGDTRGFWTYAFVLGIVPPDMLAQVGRAYGKEWTGG
jgi:hypothetical protein